MTDGQRAAAIDHLGSIRLLIRFQLGCVRETEKIPSRYARKLAPLSPIVELVAKTLAVGAYEMQVEFEDRKEHVFAFQEGVGFGIASLDASSEEARALREALYQIRRKQKIVTIEGIEYRLRARIHESFGEEYSE
jgi:hypothetical protein